MNCWDFIINCKYYFYLEIRVIMSFVKRMKDFFLERRSSKINRDLFRRMISAIKLDLNTESSTRSFMIPLPFYPRVRICFSAPFIKPRAPRVLFVHTQWKNDPQTHVQGQACGKPLCHISRDCSSDDWLNIYGTSIKYTNGYCLWAIYTSLESCNIS